MSKEYDIVSVSTISRVTGRKKTYDYTNKAKKITISHRQNYFYDVPHQRKSPNLHTPDYSKCGENQVTLSYSTRDYGWIEKSNELAHFRFDTCELGDNIIMEQLKSGNTRILILSGHTIIELVLACKAEDIITQSATQYIRSMGFSHNLYDLVNE